MDDRPPEGEIPEVEVELIDETVMDGRLYPAGTKISMKWFIADFLVEAKVVRRVEKAP